MKCFFCNSRRVRALSPIEGNMTFRCWKCNVRFIVTNPSSVDLVVRLNYWRLVSNGLLTKAKSFGIEARKEVF